jgi:transcription elongation factor GreB
MATRSRTRASIPRSGCRQGTRNYITPGGHARIKDRTRTLLRVERPQVVGVVQWAASNGDRSENADYIYGKRRLREIDRRIRFLTKRLDLAEIVDPARRGRIPSRCSLARR